MGALTPRFNGRNLPRRPDHSTDKETNVEHNEYLDRIRENMQDDEVVEKARLAIFNSALLVAQLFMQAFDTNYKGHPLVGLKTSLALLNEDNPSLKLIDWDVAMDLAPVRTEGEESSLKDVVFALTFYTQLSLRGIVWADHEGRSMGKEDYYLLAMMKVMETAAQEIALLVDYPQLLAFLDAFTDHGVTMAVMAGTLVPIEGHEGQYAAPAAATKLTGPWGLSKEAFLQMPFPEGEDVYDTIMGAVQRAEACIAA